MSQGKIGAKELAENSNVLVTFLFFSFLPPLFSHFIVKTVLINTEKLVLWAQPLLQIQTSDG